MPIFRVDDVLNYGGFFGGDTVTLTTHPLNEPSNEQTLTIDQGALTNVGGDRYKIVGGMALVLQFEGERVASAAVLAAKERETLRNAVVEAQAQGLPLQAPRLFAYHCQQCDLWILGEPHDGKCSIEGHTL